MSKTSLRWFAILLMLFAVIVTACAPTPAPSPTRRPPTEEPTATEAEAEETEAVAEVATEEEEIGEETESAAEVEETEAAAEPTEMEEETEAAAEPTEMEETEVAIAVEPTVVEEETEAAAEPTEMEEETEVAVEPTVMEETETAEPTVRPTRTQRPTVEPTEAETEVAMATEAVEPTEMEATEEQPMVTEAPTMEATEATTSEAAVANVGDVTITSGDKVVVGLAAGLSGEGIAPLGIDIQRGAELAVAARPTVTVEGQEFEVALDVQDDLCSAEGGQTVANRFVSSEGVVGVVGPMCSSACRAAAPIFDSADFTSISPSCTAPDLTSSDYSSFNRSVVSDAFQGRIAADFIYNNLGITRIATIHDGSPYGEGLVNVLTDRFTELGGEVVAADAVNVGDTDFRSLLEDIAQEEPELIYFGGFPAEAARIAEQRADAGLEDVVMMGADGIRGTEVVDLAGESADGLWASSALPSSSAEFEAFLNLYQETYGEEPPAPYHGTAYDAVNILLDAVEATGTVDADGNLVVSRDAISEYVRSLENFQGLTGVLNAEGNGETSVSDIGIYQVENGAFTLKYVGRVVDGEIVIEEAPAEQPEMATEEAAAATEEAAATAEATQAS